MADKTCSKHRNCNRALCLFPGCVVHTARAGREFCAKHAAKYSRLVRHANEWGDGPGPSGVDDSGFYGD